MASVDRASIARQRLTKERKDWRKDHPPGFYARPSKTADGGTDLFKWEAGIPGKINTPWEGGVYKLKLEFPPEYPGKPPLCRFDPPLFHPNVYPSGSVCLSILAEDKDWKPTLTFKAILQNIQNLLNDHNLEDPAQREAYKLAKDDPGAYAEKVRQIAAANAL